MANVVYTGQAVQSQLMPIDKCLKKTKESDERFKKGEWSDGAIHSLLDAYETKWNHRNRGNLRVGDWEEVCSHVSNRIGGAKSMKTPAQCKNKLEGMKKKYRFEALEGCSNNRMSSSSWPFFSRMDIMLRRPTHFAGIPGGMDAGYQGMSPNENGETFDIQDEYHVDLHHHNRQESEQEEDVSNNLLQRNENFALVVLESETSGPANKFLPSPSPSPKGKQTLPNKVKMRRQTKNNNDVVASSIRSFADSILKLEQAKMEMLKDTERLRAETEARRAELELKRTEIIMSTQLQIAKLLSSKSRKRKSGSGASQYPATTDAGATATTTTTPINSGVSQDPATASTATTTIPISLSVDEVTHVSGVEIVGHPIQSADCGSEFIVPEPSSMQHSGSQERY